MLSFEGSDNLEQKQRNLYRLQFANSMHDKRYAKAYSYFGSFYSRMLKKI